MTDDEREHECAVLSQGAARWIVKQLAGTRRTEFRGTHDLENEIYGWLWEHAVFDEEESHE